MTVLATANLGNASDKRVGHGLDHLADLGVNAIGCQEAGDRRRMLDDFCGRHGWHAWYGTGIPGAASTPILWNPHALRAIHQRTRPATPATYTGRIGAGPSTVKPKVWNYIRFEADHDPFVFINGHLPASLWAPKRRALAERQVAVLEDMCRRREDKVDVFAVMDGNSKPDDRIWRGLRRLGMHQHTKGATHGRRTIDLGWSFGQATSEIFHAPSDHEWVVFTIKEKH